MNIPFGLIGSDDLHNQIVQDIEALIEVADERKLIPMLLIVGVVFVEVAAAQSILHDHALDNWESAIKKYPKDLSKLFKKKKEEIYGWCLEGKGRLGSDEKRQIDIFFDPDEPYMTLRGVDKNNKAKDNEPKTKQGYAICVLRFKPEQILPDYKFELC